VERLPEEGRETTERGRPRGLSRRNGLQGAFRTRPFSPHRQTINGEANRSDFGGSPTRDAVVLGEQLVRREQPVSCNQLLDRPPEKARERRVSGASRNLEVGGCGGPGVERSAAQRREKAQRRCAPRAGWCKGGGRRPRPTAGARDAVGRRWGR
jgi:hypothetical protein